MYGNRRFISIILLLIGLWAVGVTGYMIIEGWNFLDAIYMTVITLTTVGFGEVHTLSPHGRIFTILLLVTGLGIFSYSIRVLAEATIEGHFKGILGRRRMQKTIEKFNSHFIICGYGRIGRTIATSIANRDIPVVVVENDPDIASELDGGNMPFIQGDATHDDTLLKAGVKRARGIVCVLHTDAANVYVTLTARTLNPALLIVARADDANAETKMIQAGADRVISPYDIGAKRMALAVLQPTVTEFLDLAIHSTSFNLCIEQVGIERGSPLDGVNLQKAAVRQQTGCTVLAVQRSDGNMIVSPDSHLVLAEGDILVTLGTAEGIKILKGLAMPS